MSFEDVPVLEGKEAERFIEQDRKSLSRKQKKYLKKCQKIYEKNPITLKIEKSIDEILKKYTVVKNKEGGCYQFTYCNECFMMFDCPKSEYKP